MKYKLILKSASILFLAFLFFSAVDEVAAANICWDGGGTTNNWSEDQNWAGDVEPGASDVAVFDNGTCSGSPNKNAAIDGDMSVQGINLAAYTGTVSLTNPYTILFGSSGFVQASGTFDIGTGTAGSTGSFTRTGGTFNGGSGTYPEGTYIYYMSSGTLSGSTTFNNLIFGDNTGDQTDNIASGTTLTVTGLLRISGTTDPNDTLDGPGVIHAKGDVAVEGEGFEGGILGSPGSVVITINGTGTQTLDGEADTDSQIPGIVIDKSSGTLNITDTVAVGGSWTYIQGTINPGSSTIIFNLNGDYSYSGTHSLNNVTFRSAIGMQGGPDITSGTTITALGNLTFDGSSDNNDTLSGPGSLAVQGNLSTVTNGLETCDVPITMTGTNAQSINLAGANFCTGNLTINKSSGTVTLGSALTLDGTGQDLVISSGILDMSTYALTVDDIVTINGGLKQGTGNFTASNGNITVGSTGWWVNNSTGDIDAEGGDTITNNGYIRWDGGSAGCGSTDDIVLTRNGTGAVNLAGSGRWRLYDITIGTTGIYAASPALTIYSSSITGSQTGITNNGTCPNERTWIGSGNYSTAANWSGTAVPGSTELAIFDASSTSNMTVDADPNDNGFQINLGYSGTITQTNGVDITLDDQGWEQNAGTFTGGDNTSDITVNNGGDFVLNTGTFTAPAGTITAKDNWTVSAGSFNPGSGTVFITGEFDNSATVTGSETFNNLQIYENSNSTVTITIASSTTLTITGSLIFDGDDGNWGDDIINGPGVFALQGDMQSIEDGWYGNVPITINGSGAQSITGAVGRPLFPGKITIDKSTGALSFSSAITFTDDWTYTQGSLNMGTSNVIFSATFNDTAISLSGSPTFYDLTFDDVHLTTTTMTIESGAVFTATNTLLFDGDNGNWGIDNINGPGTIVAQGDLTTANDGFTGNVPITFSGSASNQTLTASSSNDFTTGTLTINKTSGTVTLGSALNLSGSGQDLTITDGTLANSSYALTVNDVFTINDRFNQGTGNVSASSYAVGGSGVWENISTGDIVIGSGGVSNAGTITLGDVNSCEATDSISITSSLAGTQRLWAGSGTFNLVDLSVEDQGGSATLTAYSSTNVNNNGTNWDFQAGCPTPAGEPFSSTWQGGTLIKGGVLIK